MTQTSDSAAPARPLRGAACWGQWPSSRRDPTLAADSGGWHARGALPTHRERLPAEPRTALAAARSEPGGRPTSGAQGTARGFWDPSHRLLKGHTLFQTTASREATEGSSLVSRACAKGNGRPCLTRAATPRGPGRSSGGESGSACGRAGHRESRPLAWAGGHRQQVTNVTTIACGPPVALKRISGDFKCSCCMTWEAKWSVSGKNGRRNKERSGMLSRSKTRARQGTRVSEKPSAGPLCRAASTEKAVACEQGRYLKGTNPGDPLQVPGSSARCQTASQWGAGLRGRHPRSRGDQATRPPAQLGGHCPSGLRSAA